MSKRSKTKAAAKWAGYLAGAYLLASWGVNGIINPMHYIKSASMQAQALEITEDGQNMVIELPQENVTAQKHFLSFQAGGQDYSFDLWMQAYTPQGDAQDINIRAWKGWNCIDLARLQGAAAWEKILVPKSAKGPSGEISLEAALLSECRRTETGRMLSVSASFLFLAAFWECIWQVKERYAQSNESGWKDS